MILFPQHQIVARRKILNKSHRYTGMGAATREAHGGERKPSGFLSYLWQLAGQLAQGSTKHAVEGGERVDHIRQHPQRSAELHG
jgi:hypothetical protein